MDMVVDRRELDIDSVAAKMMVDPVECFDESYENMHAIERDTLEAIQLSALKTRFGQLRDSIPMLKKLADDAGVHKIETLEDVIPILFKHTVYKSYPVSLLEKSRFTQLTQWLQKLTLVDLSKVDVSRCQGIDEWIAVLDRDTPLMLRNSSGTSGTMSFLPRTRAESEKHFLTWHLGLFQLAGLTPPVRGKPVDMHVVHANYRRGPTSAVRVCDLFVKYLCNGEEAKLHTLYPHTQSADLMFLAARMRAAEAKGELDRLQLSPALLARRGEFERLQRENANDLKRFFADITVNLKGETIFMNGTWNVLYNLAAAGLAEGIEGVFAPNSLINTGGGSKGQVVPPDWEGVVKRFFGIKHLNHGYGMSEVMALHKKCDHDRFHIEPWTVLFVLDPDTGEPLPRKGVQTGRCAFYDLQPESYWGGFVSGDEITVDWSTPCACGRLSPHIHSKIERYSEKRGGDDKITCAAAPEAHESALKYLNDFIN